MLPIELPEGQIDMLAKMANTGRCRLDIDLTVCEIILPDGIRIGFHVPSEERSILLEGLDAIGLTLKRAAQISAFQRIDRQERPWIWSFKGLL